MYNINTHHIIVILMNHHMGVPVITSTHVRSGGGGVLRVVSSKTWFCLRVVVGGVLAWLRTNGVSTHGAAGKVMNCDGSGKKVRPGTSGKIKVGKRECPKKVPLSKSRSWNLQRPH